MSYKFHKTNYTLRILTIGFGILLLVSACIDKMMLPADLNDDDSFSAGDTTYIKINPVWGAEYGFQTPMDISIGRDGCVFIADSADGSIFVLEQDGDIPTGFSSLKNLFIEDSTVSPVDVDIDEKMNVLFVDGSEKIYRWNQLWNMIGIHAVSQSGTFTHETMGDSFAVSGSNIWNQFANDSEWILTDVTWDSTTTRIDSLLQPHVIYNGSLPWYTQTDAFYESRLSTFFGISAYDGPENGFLVTDNHFDRIIRIQWKRTFKIQLKTGIEVWAHDGLFDHKIEGYGTGAGSVNKPLGIDIDYDGNIYYSQSGDYFGVHKIKKAANGYPSVFQEGINEIMQVNLFSNPQDIAVDDRQMIYITNTNEHEIQVFDADGQFFRKVGIEEMIVDTTLTIITETDTTVVDTFITVEVKNELTEPRGVTVDDRGVVYIVDTPTQQIVRYRLSNQLDENLNPLD